LIVQWILKASKVDPRESEVEKVFSVSVLHQILTLELIQTKRKVSSNVSRIGILFTPDTSQMRD
jgi:hypothetical protein